MAHQTEVVLLLILTIATTAFAVDVEKPLSEDYFDQLVKESLNREEKGTCPGCCPLGWVKYNGRCHSYFGVSLDWASAEASCLRFGANLMSVHNENDYKLAKSLVHSYDPFDSPTWLGLSSCQKKNNWFWSDGTKVSFTQWNPNEPNVLNGECCVKIKSKYNGWKDWENSSCDWIFPFLCAKKINS